MFTADFLCIVAAPWTNVEASVREVSRVPGEQGAQHDEGHWHTAPKVMAVFEASRRKCGGSLKATEVERYAEAGDGLDGTTSEAHG